MGDDLDGLFLLAMADSLAGQGPEKPADIEESLVALYHHIQDVAELHVKPVLEAPPLLNGHDLIQVFGLQPGPLFKIILAELAVAQVEGKVKIRQEAKDWVVSYLHHNSP